MYKIITILLVALFIVATPLVAETVPTLDKDELKARIGSEDLVILDVRTGRDWSTSEFKIEGAIRVDGKDLSVANSYSKDHTYVLYCA